MPIVRVFCYCWFCFGSVRLTQCGCPPVVSSPRVSDGVPAVCQGYFYRLFFSVVFLRPLWLGNLQRRQNLGIATHLLFISAARRRHSGWGFQQGPPLHAETTFCGQV